MNDDLTVSEMGGRSPPTKTVSEIQAVIGPCLEGHDHEWEAAGTLAGYPVARCPICQRLGPREFASAPMLTDELPTLRAENERLAAACRDLTRQRDEARAKVSELAVKLGEARRQNDALR